MKMRCYGLSFKERLHKTGEFRQVYKGGIRASSNYFVWFFLCGEGTQPERRLGITVTKDVGKANERNRIKRQVREFFRLNKHKAPKGWLVVKARRGSAGVKNVGLRGDLAEGLRRLVAKVGEGNG